MNKRSDLGNHKIAIWLMDEKWTMMALEHHLKLSRATIRKHLDNPFEHMTMETMTRINYLLKKKRLVDIVNAVTEAPLCSDFYVQDHEFIEPVEGKKRWYDD